MPRKPRPRFTVDEESIRGSFHNPSIQHFRILFDGRDHGIRAWDDIRNGDRIDLDGTMLPVPRGWSPVRWLNEQFDLADLPPLRTEQLEMEI